MHKRVPSSACQLQRRPQPREQRGRHFEGALRVLARVATRPAVLRFFCCRCLQISVNQVDALQASPPLHERFPNVEHIDLDFDTALEESEFVAFVVNDARHMSRLVKLHLFALGLTGVSFMALAHCTGLQVLDLPLDRDISPSELYALQLAPGLHTLTVAIAHKQSSLSALGGLTRLRTLELWMEYNGNFDAIDHVFMPHGLACLSTLTVIDGGSRFDFSALRGLTSLTVEWASDEKQRALATLGAASLSSLAGLPNLLRMSVFDIDRRDLPDHFAVASVTSLSLSRGFAVAVASVTVLSCFPSLQHLDFFNAHESDVVLISRDAMQLRSLRLSLANNSDAGAACLHLSRMTELSHLDFVGKVSDQHLFDVVAAGGLQSLCSLELTNSNFMTDEALLLIADLPKLSSIELRHCHSFTQVGLLGLVLRAPRLRDIRLRGCRGLTGHVVEVCRQRAAALRKHIHIELEL